jgi:hypothetical protein
MSVETEISNQLFSSIPEKSHIQKPIKILTDRQVRAQSTIDQVHPKNDSNKSSTAKAKLTKNKKC